MSSTDDSAPKAAAAAVAKTPPAVDAATEPMPLDPVQAAQQRARFALVAGPGQLHASVLALLLTPGRAREMAVWRDECRHTVGAKELRNELMKIATPGTSIAIGSTVYHWLVTASESMPPQVGVGGWMPTPR